MNIPCFNFIQINSASHQFFPASLTQVRHASQQFRHASLTSTRRSLKIAAVASTLQGEWIKVEQKGKNIPKERSSHGIAVVGDKLYAFGGEFCTNKAIDKDMYVFDLNTQTWSLAPAKGDVPEISSFGVRMVAVGTKLYVFGGRNEKNVNNDFYSYDTVKNEWKFLTKLGLGGGPEARTYHSMASDENHVYVFGGVSQGDGVTPNPHRFRTVESYNISDGKWAQLPDPGNNFEKRGGAGFHVVQGKIWVVYGFSSALTPDDKGDRESDKVQYFDLASQTWTEVETKGEEKPSARSVFASAVVGKHILIFGGETSPDECGHFGTGTLSNEGFALDTETLVWERFKGGDEPDTRG